MTDLGTVDLVESSNKGDSGTDPRYIECRTDTREETWRCEAQKGLTSQPDFYTDILEIDGKEHEFDESIIKNTTFSVAGSTPKAGVCRAVGAVRREHWRDDRGEREDDVEWYDKIDADKVVCER